MNEKWTKCKVAEVAAPTENALATGPFGSNIGSRFFQSSGIPVIRGSNLSQQIDKRLIEDDFVFVSEEKASEFSRSIARKGDLIFTCWGTINQVGLIDDLARYDEYVISNKQMKLTPDPQKADSLFLYYLFSGLEKQQEILSIGIGSSVPGFNLGQLKAIEILLPPLSVQKKIVRILSSFDDKIELNRQINHTLEQMAQAIFKSWFVDFDPVKAKAQGGDSEAIAQQLGISREILDLFPSEFEDTELGPIPKGWKNEKIGELFSETIGGDWGSEALDEKHTEKVRVIRGTDIPTLKNFGFRSIPTRYLERKRLDKKRLYHGDIILEVSGGSKGQPTGRSLYVVKEILERLINDAVAASFCRLLRPINLQTGAFLSQYLHYIYTIGKTWNYQNQSTGLSNFQTRIFLEREIVCYPCDKILKIFYDLIRPMLAKQNSNESVYLEQLRDLLLPKLISGEISVSEHGETDVQE